MFRKKKLPVFLLVLAFVSCSEKEENVEPAGCQERTVSLTKEEYMSVFQDGIPELSDNDIIALAANFIVKAERVTTKSSPKITFIEKVKTKGESAEVDLNYLRIEQDENIGFAVVSSDKSFSQVVAYIPKGELADTLWNEGFRMMLNLSKASAVSQVNKFETKQGSLKESTIDKICKELNIARDVFSQYRMGTDILVTDTRAFIPSVCGIIESVVAPPVTPIEPPVLPVEPENPEEEEDEDSDSDGGEEPEEPILPYVPALLKTQWGQRYPYNGMYPEADGCNMHAWYKNRYMAGCVMVAGAQIIAYLSDLHQIPGKYNWNILANAVHIKANPVTDDEIQAHMDIQEFMWELAEKCYPLHFNCTGTGGYTFHAVKQVDSYSLKSTKIFEQEDVLEAVSHNMPIWASGKSIYPSGESHSLVIDGYIAREEGLVDHIHCNFGWLGGDDGWYGIEEFEYSRSLEMWRVEKK